MTTFKTTLYFLGIFCFFFTSNPLTAHAGESGGGGVGNGGGSWTCRAASPGTELIWARLVDLDEARRELSLEIPITGPMAGPILAPRDWLAAGNSYLTLAEQRLQQASPSFYAEYLRRKTDLLKSRILLPSDSEFDHTSDILHHTRPDSSTCPTGQVSSEPEQLANFTTLGNLEINAKIWGDPALSEIDRAALFVHEVIYWIFRDFAGDRDSLRTRVIVGYLFSSATPVSQFASMITLTPQRADALGLPLLYGMFAEIAGRWVDIEINSYNTATHELQLTQKDRDNQWAVKSRATFKCEPRGSEYRCAMILNSKGSPAEWWDRHLRIIDPSTFVWIKLKHDGSVQRATQYSKIR